MPANGFPIYPDRQSTAQDLPGRGAVSMGGIARGRGRVSHRILFRIGGHMEPETRLIVAGVAGWAIIAGIAVGVLIARARSK